jgi:hypothetical protein
VAPEKNLNGYYNVYAVSLNLQLAGVVESTNGDGGKTWTTGNLIPVPNPLGVPPTINDRPG